MAPKAEMPRDPAIVAGHIRAVHAVWFASQLERLRFFDVADRIAERFQAGMLPLGRDAAMRRFLGAATVPGGLSAEARRQLLVLALGQPGSHSGMTANREFQVLWLRFVSSVSTYAGQPEASALLRARTQRAVWHSARALAMQLSAWGGGSSFFAAKELAREANRIRVLLQDPALRDAFGARDMWGVIDRVSGDELGGTRNAIRYRKRALAGSALLQWLADHVDALLQNPEPPANADLPDAVLRKAMAQWLALALAGQAQPPPLKAGAAAKARARADRVQVESRYIGETEKHLSAVFERVKDSKAVLLFDEADALFGRRT